MKLRSTISCLVLTLTTLFVVAYAGQIPVRNLQVTLRGKKYDIADDVTTVAELQERVQEQSGVSTEHSVLFDGKRLDPNDILSDVGVNDGSKLNMIPSTAGGSSSTKSSGSGTSSTPKNPKKKITTTTTTTTTSTEKVSSKANGGADAGTDAMKEYLKGAGIDTDKLDELVNGMGGGLGGGGSGEDGMPSMKESMEMMSSMMNSPIFQEYMSDPEKLEQSRQMILNNPMLKSMMGGMPGMEELLNSPEAWREAMQAAASLYKNMDREQLMSAMMGGAGGGMPGGGMGGFGGMQAGGAGGLFDGTLDSAAASESAKATTAALDELDEDD